jgi:hypothetical protein
MIAAVPVIAAPVLGTATLISCALAVLWASSGLPAGPAPHARLQ